MQSSTASITANTTLITLPAVGLARIRLTMTAFTSGSAAVSWNADTTGLAVISNAPTSNSATGIVAGTGVTSLGKAEDAPAVSGDTGVAVWGVRNDTGTTTTNTDGDYTQLSTNLQGSLATQNRPNASQNWAVTQFRLASAATTNATSVKGSAGNVYMISVANTSLAVKYLKFYNKATAPTVGTDVPTLVIGIPTASTYFFNFDVIPLPFATGIALATTGLGTDVDATAVAASDLMITVLYA